MSHRGGVTFHRRSYREATAVVASLVDPSPGSRGSLDPPHGAGTSPPRFQTAAVGAVLNVRGYLAACEMLYEKVFAVLETRRERGTPPRILDAGGSFGAFGLALARIGMPVVVWERFAALGSRADPVIAALDRAGVSVAIREPGQELPPEVCTGGEFDLIVCLALHRLSPTAREVAVASGELLSPDAELVLGVANRDFWPAPLRRLRGRETREYAESVVALAETATTRRELLRLLGDGGLRPIGLSHTNYTPRSLGSPMQQLLLDNVMRVRPRWREIMLARAVRKEGR